MVSHSFEIEARKNGYINICGVDEAGRGPLLGPVVAAAVILPANIHIDKLDDSKKISEKVREILYADIMGKAVCLGVGIASVEEINELNIKVATALAMNRAVANLETKADFVLVDGNDKTKFPVPSMDIIGGDALSISIAAASIIAKVTRDKICYDLDLAYPGYGISKHKGYGTKQHMEALREKGPTPVHRTKFIRFLDKAE